MDFYHTDVRGITFGCRARRISRSSVCLGLLADNVSVSHKPEGINAS